MDFHRDFSLSERRDGQKMNLTEFFRDFHSNTLAASGNQSWFETEGAAVVGRVFYRVFAGGEYRYSLLFSDAMDSTFSDGQHSHVNQVLGDWEIVSARVGIVARADMEGFDEPSEWKTLTFDGAPSKAVAPGESFATDPVVLRTEKDAYLCLETTVRGARVPCHPETLLPSFVKTEDGWTRSVNTLFAGMVGCDRPVKLRVAYLGDSITQGCGTKYNTYEHWNAVLSEALGTDCAFWNLGLGYARARDAATDGGWLYKAKQNDLVVVCMGVNDMPREASAEAIMQSLQTIVRKLREAGVRVLLQTIPPFNYPEGLRERWLMVNDWIRSTLAGEADALFDVVPVLSESPERPYMARYGGHPDGTGCAAWAAALKPTLSALIDRTVASRQ